MNVYHTYQAFLTHDKEGGTEPGPGQIPLLVCVEADPPYLAS